MIATMPKVSPAPIRGVVAAIATPARPDRSPDGERFIKLAGRLLENGCDGLNVLGTTGEGTSFSHKDRIALMSLIAKSGLAIGRMIVGVGAAAVKDAAELTLVAAELGFRGALVLPPFYYKNVTQDGILRFFGNVVAATRDRPIPIYLYNFPAMSGIAFSPELVLRLLAEFGDRIAGIKDSSGNLTYATEVARSDSRLAVFPSNEATLMQARAGHFAGCISATANVNADLCSRAFHLGDEDALAKAVQIRALFDGKTLVPGVKALLAHIYNDDALTAVVPPLQEWPEKERVALINAYQACRLADQAKRRDAAHH
jgi:4-hydroxy-tetrahydrodipicolinate synthase